MLILHSIKRVTHRLVGKKHSFEKTTIRKVFSLTLDSRTDLALIRRFFSGILPANTISHSYLHDLSAIALLLLPLTLANATAILFGHAFRLLDYSAVSTVLFQLSNMLINIYPLSFCVVAGYYLSHKTSINSAVFIIYSIALFYLVSIENGSLSAGYYLPNNPFLALISALVTFLYCTRFNLRFLEPQALDFASRLFKHVAHFFVFMISALAISKLTVKIVALFTDVIGNNGADPLTFFGGLTYQTILGLLGAIGINGHNMLFATKQQLYATTQANFAAYQAGDAPLNVLSQGFYDAFTSMGGSGGSISLLLCILLFSRSRNHIMLALAATPLVIFNINEVLLFGLPIIFNPIMIVPFILVPLVSFVLTYFAITYGFVPPVESIVNWMTPPLFSGYIAMGDNIIGSLLQLVIIVIGIFIYRPFYLTFSGKYSVHLQSIEQVSSIEKSTFKSLLENVRSATASSMNKSLAQQRLSSMMREGELVMHYQLLQSVKTKRIVSYEALLRYKDGSGKLCPPTFINDFQLLNAMPMLDRAVIEQVLKDMQKLPLSSEQRVAINISVASIGQGDFVSHLLSRLAHYEISPTWLELEITEEAIINDKMHLLGTMEKLQSEGILIAMDDFGTGYASFPHLIKYPFNKVKLDRSLLLGSTTPKGRDLYHLVAQLGSVTNCIMVAEGVETQEEYDFIAECGVDVVQGYLIARPQPLADIIEKYHSA